MFLVEDSEVFVLIYHRKFRQRNNIDSHKASCAIILPEDQHLPLNPLNSNDDFCIFNKSYVSISLLSWFQIKIDELVPRAIFT